MNHLKTINTVLFSILFLILPCLAFAQPVPTAPTAPSANSQQSQPSIAEDIIVKLQVPLPFVPDNPNLSQYMKGVYRLLIGAGALFAVIMIIIAGYQWMFSGGSSDKTGAAKKRILGAVVGLMLALLSYIILNSITPRLVALDMPVVPPVPRLEFAQGETCKDSARLKQYEDQGMALKVQEKTAQLGSLPGGQNYSMKDRSEAYCGTKYDVYSIDASPVASSNKKAPQKIDECMGGYCDGDDKVCILNQCVNAIVHGNVTSDSDYHLNEIDVYKICNGIDPFYFRLDEVAKKIFDYKPGGYTVSANDLMTIDETCLGPFASFLGYALLIKIDDGYTETDNFFMVGNDCNKSFAKGNYKDPLGVFELYKDNKEVVANNLITASQLKGGFRCVLDLASPAFADYD